MLFWKIRLIATVLLIPAALAAAFHPRWVPASLALMLLFLDMLDSFVIYADYGSFKKLECDVSYQCADKIVDQVQNAFALIIVVLLFPSILKGPIWWTLVATCVWRGIGVVLFARDGCIGAHAKRWLVAFPDVTKELLLVASLFEKFEKLPATHSVPIIIAVLLLKTGFEALRWRHAHNTCDRTRAT